MRIEMCKIYHVPAFNGKIMSKQGKKTNRDEPEQTEISQLFLLFFVLNMCM